jgi:hypothetical protein
VAVAAAEELIQVFQATLVVIILALAENPLGADEVLGQTKRKQEVQVQTAVLVEAGLFTPLIYHLALEDQELL